MSDAALLQPATAPSAARGEGGRSFPDRFNPVLVKELRASLRGRYLRILFPVTLFAAAVLAIGVLVDVADGSGNAPGRELFQACFVSMCVALLGIVPFSAFLSMGNEWEEHTYDLLVISNLRPRHIVLGKLFAVGIEAGLYFSAFTPFIVFSYLLRGLDLLTIGVALVCALVTSFSISAVALGLSSLSRVRVVRALLMAALGALCVFAISMSFGFSNVIARHGLTFARPEEFWILSASLAGILAPGLLAIALAATMLAHAEENASTAPRIAVSVILLGYSVFFVALQLDARQRDVPIVYAVGALVFAALCDLFFVTERETLGLHVKTTVPASPVRAWLALPWLPGGGRAWALFLMHLALVVAVTQVLVEILPEPNRRWDVHPAWSALVLGSYFVVFLGVPSLIGWAGSARARGRVLTRVAIPLFALACLFVPAVLGFLVSERSWSMMEHPFNPFWVALDDRAWELVRIGVVGFAALVAIANLLRTARGAAEVARASSDRREREARARATDAASVASQPEGSARGS